MPVTRSSATRSSWKVVPRRRMAELENIQCLSDMKTADAARSSKGRIAELQTEDGIDSMCNASVVLRDYYGGEDKAQESLDCSR